MSILFFFFFFFFYFSQRGDTDSRNETEEERVSFAGPSLNFPWLTFSPFPSFAPTFFRFTFNQSLIPHATPSINLSFLNSTLSFISPFPLIPLFSFSTRTCILPSDQSTYPFFFFWIRIDSSFPRSHHWIRKLIF